MSKTITVSCQDSSHADEPFIVAVFLEVENRRMPERMPWEPEHLAIQSPRWELADNLYTTRGGVKQKLLAENYIHPSRADEVDGPEVHERYRFACERCSLCVTRRIHVDPEQDPVQRALDKIDAAGLDEVALSTLAAILERS